MPFMLIILNTISVIVSAGTPRLLAALIAAVLAVPPVIALFRHGKNTHNISTLYTFPAFASGLLALTLAVEGGL